VDDIVLSLNFTYFFNTKTIKPYHDAGFYSVINETIKCIFILLSNGIVPENIDFSLVFYFYKRYQNQNIYSYCFKLNPEITDLPTYKKIHLQYCNDVVDRINLTDDYTKIVERYFNPSDKVIFYELYFTDKYKIDFKNTICILYRGTDKWQETNLLHPKVYLDVVNKILKNNPKCKVLVQTDQTQVKEYFRDKLGDKFLCFDELPTTKTTKVGFHAIIEEYSIDKIKFAMMFDAAIRCISKCKYVVCGPGNVSLMVRLYRETCDGMYMFTGNNELFYKYNEIYYTKCLKSGQINICHT
jgi:hypothetical protein